jgi:hypothetical protein
MGHPDSSLTACGDRVSMTARPKPRAERHVQFVRGSFFAGEE